MRGLGCGSPAWMDLPDLPAGLTVPGYPRQGLRQGPATRRARNAPASHCTSTLRGWIRPRQTAWTAARGRAARRRTPPSLVGVLPEPGPPDLSL